MTSLALALLLVPLLMHRRSAASRDAYNLAVYRDQLAEIERDVARGVADRRGSRGGAGRDRPPHPGAESGEGRNRGGVERAGRRQRWRSCCCRLPPWMLYWQLGSPSLPDQPFAARRADGSAPVAGNAPHIDINAAITRLAAHLKTHPEDLDGWLLLGRSEQGLGHYQEAAQAYRHAEDLSGNRADIAGDWGEALVLAAGGTVTPAAREAFEAALKDPENAPRSRYYLALAQTAAGRCRGRAEGLARARSRLAGRRRLAAAGAAADRRGGSEARHRTGRWQPDGQAAGQAAGRQRARPVRDGGRRSGESGRRRIARGPPGDDQRDGRAARGAARTAAG